jgi:hypothetical protein
LTKVKSCVIIKTLQKKGIDKMKENCFVRFSIEGEDGIQYGIHNPEANIIMCACCGGIYTPGEDAVIWESMEIGLEAYDAIMDAFEEDKFWKRLKKKEEEIKKGLDKS